MGISQKDATGKKEGTYNEKGKWRYEKGKFHMEKELNTITKNNEIKSNIEKKYDKHGNKISMYETVKEVEEETIIEENIMSLTRDNTTSL